MNFYLAALLGFLIAYGVTVTWIAYKWRSLCFRWRTTAVKSLSSLIEANTLLQRWQPMLRPTAGEWLAYETEDYLAAQAKKNDPPATG